MKKILFVEPILAHYRKDTFNQIFSDKRFAFKLIAGDRYEDIHSAIIEDSEVLKYRFVNFLGVKLYFLVGTFRYVRTYKPEIIVCSGVDFHLLHTIFLFAYIRMFTKTKFIWWSHATKGNQGWFGFWLRGLFYKNSHGVFVYNSVGMENLLLMGVSKKKIVIVGNALNYNDYGFNHAENEVKLISRPLNLLFSGRINTSKKLHILIEALTFLQQKEINPIKCFVIGGGDTQALMNLASKLEVIDKIEFVGPQYAENIIPYFQNSDIFVYPGGIGLSLVHAYSFGLPVITTNNMDVHGPEIELLKQGVNGDFFTDNDSADLANKIQKWASKILTQREDIKNRCVNIVREYEYLPDRLATKVLSFLEMN